MIIRWRTQWDKYWWIVAASILVLIVSRIMFGRAPFCSSAEEHCFREWISALGGWAAVAVAVPTIIYMQRQIEDARKHHRETLMITVRQRIEAAREAIRAAEEFEENRQRITDELSRTPDEDAYPALFISQVEACDRLANNPDVEAFLADAPRTLSRWRRNVQARIKRAEDAITNYIENIYGDNSENLREDLRIHVTVCMAIARGLAFHYRKEAERYIVEAQNGH